ncbi:hypothetical protein K1T71_000656 [Dendrolimus kikuchii]|uniref:Uncharacterized protein n=1 Tax=Dendrolimus kikuchii TaxID=765133 RepID=A0ACC1DJV0_9NEOP|nr:hypothetical protein K1T71_000656 [Dendrolimus kikuchii]
MNLEDYVNHSKQKYKLFIALTILKTKPDNVSIENYINILRNKLENEIDLNSICSDDFLYKDDDEIMPNIQSYNNDTQALNIGEVTADAQCFPSLERNDIQNIHTTTNKRKSDMNQLYNLQNDQVSTKMQEFSNNVQGDINIMQNDKDDKMLHDTFTQSQCPKHQDNDISLRDLKTEELKSNTQISNNSANGKSQDDYSAGNSQYDYNAINNTQCNFNDADIDLENDFNIHKTSQNNFGTNNITLQNEFNTQNIVTENDFNFENLTTQNDNNEIYVTSIKEINMDDDVIKVNTKNDANNENINVSDDERNQIVPFKIIDELNRVKSYFNRKVEIRQSRDGWSESGYRSDTQGPLQLSITCLNQSAHCLLNFLTNYPLLPQTNEITSDISMNYLPFLEELLDCISSLLKRLHQEENEEDMLLKKEELSQRIIFLNKSVHIQKFTIEKIANILDATHTELIKKDAKREIQNISTIENLCYVFNILQVLLPKFLEHRENSSQPSQNEERGLTRSSLSDIWRMRWSGEIKIKSSEQNEEKCNVVEKLSEILNKLIVDCMDGYSLIAYFSLKCFNLLQSHK